MVNGVADTFKPEPLAFPGKCSAIADRKNTRIGGPAMFIHDDAVAGLKACGFSQFGDGGALAVLASLLALLTVPPLVLPPLASALALAGCAAVA